MSSLKGRVLLLACAAVAMAASIWPESVKAVAPVTPTSAEVVEQMRLHNQTRVDGLKTYKEVRHYRVVYSGLTSLVGQMEVEVDFDTSAGKTFRIVSQSGSKLLC